MKKLLLMIMLFLAFFSIETRAQSGGGKNMAVELSLSPFDDTKAWLTPYYLKGRAFFSDFGARLSFGTNMLFRGDQENNPESVKNYAFFDVRPGIEYHIGATNEAIPFVGIDFIYQMRNANIDATVGAPITGAWDIALLENRGFTAIGFNIVAGGDYYIKGGNLFVGTELGFEFLRITNHEVLVGNETVAQKTKASQFRPTLNSSIRIGIAF
ncbi:MAG: hypothetical protein PHU27_07480 [Salinivirgaceae bacterium]|nr:hypothetical protein [Salinivirgaceae bacterium]MDD4746756.1 hypothetical protein [Salinivirgaceae bacterium]